MIQEQLPSMSDPRNVVRLARPSDFDQLFEICKIMHEEHSYHTFPFSDEKVKAELESSIALNDGIIGIIGEDVIEACAWLYYGQADWYTEASCLSERMLIVHPQFRRGTFHIRNLLAWVNATVEHFGTLVVGVISNNRTAAKVRLYRRRFGEPSGVIHFWMPGGNGGRR